MNCLPEQNKVGTNAMNYDHPTDLQTVAASPRKVEFMLTPPTEVGGETTGASDNSQPLEDPVTYKG